MIGTLASCRVLARGPEKEKKEDKATQEENENERAGGDSLPLPDNNTTFSNPT